MSKVLITTVPFAENNSKPLDLLKQNNISYTINPLNKKLTESELFQLLNEHEAIIAGTEIISEQTISKTKNLKIISRVGIGLDGVDLTAAKKNDVVVSYTPDAPAPAVAELTIGLMLSLLRSIHLANQDLHEKKWKRLFGRRIEEMTVGLIGFGRIGQRVAKHLDGFSAKRILINDIDQSINIKSFKNCEWSTKENIYQKADIVSLHLPLNFETKNLITKKQLLSFKKDALVINTSRGGIINEQDLFDVLSSQHLAGAAMDVFENEPYEGVLTNLKSCLLTSHMGSMSVDCREKMELEATEEVIRFFKKESLKSLVPQSEYDLHKIGRKS